MQCNYPKRTADVDGAWTESQPTPQATTLASVPMHTQLWTFSEVDGHQFVIESKKASTRHLPKGFALVGAQLKKTAEGHAILSGLDGQE